MPKPKDDAIVLEGNTEEALRGGHFRIALDNGIRYAYTGNVHDAAGQSTRCPGCGELVIERDWYRLGAYRLTGRGRCASCDARIPGVFDGPPGTWGPRRLPVRLAPPAA